MRRYVRRAAAAVASVLLVAPSLVAAADPDVTYGSHGGVTDIPPGSYVCVVYDAPSSSCLVRAITEDEILAAIEAVEYPNGVPGWLRTSVRNGGTGDEIGLPVQNEFGLPGLMTAKLNPAQTALVRCLGNTQLAQPLAQWDDAEAYRKGTAERCIEETGSSGSVGRLPVAVPTLAQRHIQEAVIIVTGTQRLVNANILFANFAGRFATSEMELMTGSMMTGMPQLTPGMVGGRGYSVDRNNRIMVDMNAQAGEVCRALNLIHGRPWLTLPTALPTGTRAGCYPSGKGYRYEYRD